MLHFIGAIIAGIIGIFATLIGIGLGLGALLLAATPFLILLLIPLLPVLLVVWILRRIGILSGPFLTFIAIVVGVFLLLGGIHNVWNHKSESIEDWIEAKRQQLETCREQGGDNVTVEWDDDDLVFTCRGKSPGEPPKDIHI
jgi:uncharacterized membrane protein YqjE